MTIKISHKFASIEREKKLAAKKETTAKNPNVAGLPTNSMSDTEYEAYVAWKAGLKTNDRQNPPSNEKSSSADLHQPLAEPSNLEVVKSVASDVAETGGRMVDGGVWGVAILAAPFTCGLSLLAAFVYSCARAEHEHKIKK